MIDDDLDRAMAVMTAAFDPHWREAWTRAQVADALLFRGTFLLLANAQGEAPGSDDGVVGFALGRELLGETELLLIGVVPDARGRGAGRRLLLRFIDETRARGNRRIFLEVRRNNSARGFYEQAGFSAVGCRPAYYRSQAQECVDAITYARDLG